MAVIQSTQKEIRYLRRKNLEEEARIIGNYYRDAIRLYGIDCVYRKLDTSEFEDFKKIIDRNTVLKRAYGCDITPDYSMSADMIVFAEVDADAFNLNKFGLVPNTEINLVFDRVQFACDMAPAAGSYREYKVDRREVVCELPDPPSPETEGQWPYELGRGCREKYTCGVLEGAFRCMIDGYEYEKEYTLPCDPYEHTDFKVDFPVNPDLYHSLKYEIENDKYLETMLFLTFKVSRVDVPGGHRNILRGRLSGGVLFFDLDQIGKYAELVHPAVGDIVEIDFPDDKNREKYEITDCFDKQLTQDGINPLLHKYVWKCKAVRYVNSHEEGAPGLTEAEQRLEERRRYDEVVQEETAKNVSMYDSLDRDGAVDEHAVYGGYDGVTEQYDKQKTTPGQTVYQYIEGSMGLDVHVFGCGSKLVTDGYDLVFVRADGTACDISKKRADPAVDAALFDSCTNWLKATDSRVVFVNIDGEACELASGTPVAEITLDSLVEHTTKARGENASGDSFYKFGGTRTYIFAAPDALYVKFPAEQAARRIG